MQTNSNSNTEKHEPTDLAQVYMREIRSNALLSREEEVELFKLVDRGERRALEAALGMPAAVESLSELVQQVHDGSLKAQDIWSPNPDQQSPSEAVLPGSVDDTLRRARALAHKIRGATAQLETSALSRQRRRQTRRALKRLQGELTSCLGFFHLHYRLRDTLVDDISTLCERSERTTPSARKRTEFAKAESSRLRRTLGLPDDVVSQVGSDIRDANRIAEQARAQIVKSYLRLVVNVAKRFRYRGLPLLDLVQEGNIGMMQAIRKFDYRLGYRFGTYATWWIRQAVHRAVADKGHTIRVPVNIYNEFLTVTNATNHLSRKLQREPAAPEIAAMAELPAARAAYVQGLFVEPVSLDLPVGDAEAEHLGDFVPDPSSPDPEHEAFTNSLAKNLRHMLNDLPPRHRKVLEERFGLTGHGDHTLKELGMMFNVSRERARQIQCAALELLNSEENRCVLREYLAG